MKAHVVKNAVIMASIIICLWGCAQTPDTAIIKTPDIAAPSQEPTVTTPSTKSPDTPLARTSPYKGKMVFYSNRNNNFDIYVMNADGTGQTRLTHHPAADMVPKWSPDGKKIVFSSKREGNHEIYLMNADGTGLIRLTNHPATDSDPAWSSDGKRIAFASDRDKNREIYVMKTDGTGLTRLTKNPAEDFFPAWSPKGTQIVFLSNRDNKADLYNWGIYTMNDDGSQPTRLTKTPARASCPAWSPDGTKIAFVSEIDGDQEIYVINCNDKAHVQLTKNDSWWDTEPAWSSDGMYIAFQRFFNDASKKTEIFIMKADGSEQTQITHDAVGNFNVDWRQP